MILRQNKACKYFPCHKNLEDCTFCYCPFYPCLNKSRGKMLHSQKTGKSVWSCEDCSWIHKKSNVDRIYRIIKNNSPLIPQSNSDTAIIILGHGSKIKKANETVNEVIRQIKKRIGVQTIEPAYLQMHQPGLHTSVQKIIKKGYKKIIIMPFFLFTGNHVSKDVPEAIAKEKQIYTNVKFIYAKNLGSDSRISDIVLDRVREAMK